MNKEAQFKSAVEANKDRIYRICCCYVRDEHERRDVFQEVLIHIWEGLMFIIVYGLFLGKLFGLF